MALKYILGGSGTGKTTYCYKEIIKSMDNSSHIIIVPDQFMLESEKKLIGITKTSSMSNCQILSFNRLAFHVFSKTGGMKGKILEDNGKSMLIRKVVSDIKDDLNYFGKSLNKNGFIEKLGETVTEFYNYCITLEMLAEQIEMIKDNESLYIKMQDLYKIYDNYIKYIEKEYISTDETLDILSDNLPNTDFLDGKEVWIDGFIGFTAQEYNIIEKLLLQAKNINVVMTTKSKGVSFENIKIYDPFFEVKLTMSKISSIAKDNNIKILEPVYFSQSQRFIDNKELTFLEDNYLSYNPNVFHDDIENISIFKAQNIYGEISQTAKKIHDLVKKQGYRYKEIAILTDNVTDYEKKINGIFREYKIPCFYDTKSDILSHPLTELIRSLVDIVVENYSYESVFRFLKTDLVMIDKENIDSLENYVLAYGISSYKWNMDRWRYGFASAKKKEMYDEETIHQTKDYFLDMIKPFTNKLKHDSKLKIKDFAIRVFQVLDNLEVTTTLDSWIVNYENKNDVILRQHKQIWSKIISVFNKLVEVLGNEMVTTHEFGKILEAGLSEMEMGIVPPSQDSVIVGDFERTRLPDVKAIFIIGANEGIIPRPTDEIGLFTDDERIALLKDGMELRPDSKRKAFEQQFSLYQMLTKSSKILYLSYSLGTIEGKVLQPSMIINKIKSIFPNLEIQEETKVHSITMAIPTFNNMGMILQNYVKGEEIPNDYLDAYVWFKQNHRYSKKLDKMEEILFKDLSEAKLSQDSVGKLYGEEIVTSASRLDKFVNCPYSYFIEYNLHAEERKMYEVATIDLGNLFHEIIDQFTKTLPKINETFKSIDKKTIDDLVDKIVDDLAETIGSEVFLSTARLQYVLKRVKRISKRSIWALSEHIKSGMFEPLGAELEFSFSGPINNIQIDFGDSKKLILTGRIDRIDILDWNDNKYVKIIDYKSGNTKFDLSDIFYGMQLQLLLYIDAIIKNGKKLFGAENFNGEVLPGGVFYFNIKDPILEYDGDEEGLEDLILKQFKMTGLVLEDSDIIKAMDKDISGYSDIIPVYLKNNGEFGSVSSVANDDEFQKLQAFVNEKVKSLAEEIFDGNIKVFPYKKDDRTGCDYCKFSSICQFDTIDKPDKYNMMSKFDNSKEILKNIKNQVDGVEEAPEEN